MTVNSRLLEKASQIKEKLTDLQYPDDETTLTFDADLSLKQGKITEALRIADEARPFAKSMYHRQLVYRIYAIASSMAGEHEKASHYMDTIIMLQYNRDIVN